MILHSAAKKDQKHNVKLVAKRAETTIYRMTPKLEHIAIKPQLQEKNGYIETLRGIAILLIVIGHVIGFDPDGGMKVANDSVWRYIYSSLQYIRIPLFTAISGWVYALHAVKYGELKPFVRKKARRLLLPMASVGTLYFLTQHMIPGTNAVGELGDIWQIYVFPYTVFWYLPSLFVIFCTVALIDLNHFCTTLRSWIVWLAISLLIVVIEPHLSSNIPNVLGVWGAACLFPFFLVGLGIKRFPELTTPRLKLTYLICFIAGILAQQSVWFFTDEPRLLRDWFLHVPVGIISSAFLLTLTLKNRLLMRVGYFAYAIFLFHSFGTSAGRMFATRLGVESNLIIFICSLIFGLIVPVVAELVIRHSALLKTLLLGRKYAPRNRD